MYDPAHLLERYRDSKSVRILLEAATKLAENNTNLTEQQVQMLIQTKFSISTPEATLIVNWLIDRGLVTPKITTHELRCGRRYALNTPYPTLEGLGEAMKIGRSRAHAIMLQLAHHNIIRIGSDYEFQRIKRMSRWADLVRQLKWVSKKYHGRCEPELIARILYVDQNTALRLAQYGEEHLGLYWGNRPQELW